jgi:RNA-directed DNA polymerase
MSTLYASVYAFANLYQAFRKARRGKRDREEVAAFELDLEENLFRLQEELAAQTYRPGPYRSFYVRDSKRRLISAAPFRDRVVHHALVAVIEPLFEPRFIGDSYANRVGKGTHAALDRCQEFARRYPYVLQLDVRQFFPSVDHAILRAQLARVIRDDGVMGLADRILESGAGVLAGEYDMVWFPGDVLWDAVRPRGLPIGNLTSQFWANVYLNDLDQLAKRTLRCRGYLRYVDDGLLFGDEKATLHAWREAVIERAARLRLTLHEGRAQVYPVSEGIPFLGFRVFPDRRRLKSERGHAARRRLRALARACAAGRREVAQLTASVQGWVAHAAHGDTWGLRRAVLGAIVAPPPPRARLRPNPVEYAVRWGGVSHP